ncbi:MAG: DUF4097 domain-containing protein [Asgard group archaeon]|nr:DUF4097 domain-containing protein [Asgard group archaeon]
MNFSHEIIGDVVVITFEFSNPIQNYFSMKTLIHNISIRFNPIAKVDYNVVTDTGSIDCDLDGKDNLVITEIYLATSTGSIDFISRSATNITIGDVSLQSSTGGVHFNFDNAQNTSLTNLNLFTSTGSILANLGKEMSLNCTDVDIETSTGSIDLIYEDIILNNDLDWAITTSTGSIDIIIVQTLISAVNVSSTFDVQTSTGSISVECDLVSDIGVEIDASTSTGSIVLPGPGSYYISPDFALKSIQYSFVLSTSTGSIEASIDF